VKHKAGKTTLIAALYASFCKGPFANLQFVGSRTLVGFAKRHHLALLNSQRDSPTTPRTSRNDPVAFFHLALTHRIGSRPLHLVMSDRSGEAYADARADTSLIGGLEELKLAERACFMLDGARLAAVDQRSGYSRQFKQMIHAFLDNNALANVSAIEVLATKTDVIQIRRDVADQSKYLDEYGQQIVDEFRREGVEIGFHRICALPKSDKKVGYLGLEDVMTRWLAPIPFPRADQPAVVDATRQIDRLSR
jgi:double-GTPase-like protein